jgi:hypothetical protein
MEMSVTTIPVRVSVIAGMNIQREIDNVMKKAEARANSQMRIMERQLHKLTATWNHDPQIQYEIKRDGDTISITVWTDDDIFFWLDQGTDVRYSTMTWDFIPKTTPGSLVSGWGKGGVDYIDEDAPRQGIQARLFMDTLFNKYHKPFNTRVAKSTAAEINRMWASMFKGKS